MMFKIRLRLCDINSSSKVDIHPMFKLLYIVIKHNSVNGKNEFTLHCNSCGITADIVFQEDCMVPLDTIGCVVCTRNSF